MNLKKIAPNVEEALKNADITSVSEFGKRLVSTIKAGRNVIATAEKGAGKTQAVIVASFDKVNKAFEGSPRIVFISDTIDEVCNIHEIFSKVAWRLDVTVDLAHDKGDMVMQRNDIFNGTEIIVGTAKRIYDLYIQNGINLNLIEYFIVDNLENVLLSGRQMELKRILEGIRKTQVIFLANTTHKRITQFLDSIPFSFHILEE